MRYFLTMVMIVLFSFVSVKAEANVMDTEQGLEWKNVANTTGRSPSQMDIELTAGGLFEGWRYATAQELMNLINNYVGFAPPVSYSAGSRTIVEGQDVSTLVTDSALGHTVDSPMFGIVGYVGDEGWSGTPMFRLAFEVLDRSDGEDVVKTIESSVVTGSTFWGFFLVRDLDPAPTGVISGFIADTSGIPIIGVNVWLWNGVEAELTITDINGHYVFINLAHANYTVFAARPGDSPSVGGYGAIITRDNVNLVLE
jgi:hypothetical protein